MKLLSAAASPFVRKVRVLIIELGIENRIEIVDPGAVTPLADNDALNAINPLGLIPALELDDGSSLYDSPLICEYLDREAGGAYFPADPEQRWHALRLQALCDGRSKTPRQRLDEGERIPGQNPVESGMHRTVDLDAFSCHENSL